MEYKTTVGFPLKGEWVGRRKRWCIVWK